MTVGEALVQLLVDYGVDTVFGIPGTHSIELYRGLADSPIRHISPRHEQGGGFMADGYARISGKPGVCFVITGPGVTNITTPLGEAYIDSIPMLVISPVNEPDPDKINRGRLHEITDQGAVTSPLTRFTATVSSAEEIPSFITDAFAIFTSGQPGPIHINIPLPILAEQLPKPWRARTLPAHPKANQTSLDRAMDYIKQAKKPVIVAGGGARRYNEALVYLAEKAAIPVITTVAGRGVISPQHPLYAGAQLRAKPVQQLIFDSDLLILLGTELAQTDHWNDSFLELLPKRQVRVNLNPDVLHETTESIAIQGDVGLVLEDLNRTITTQASNVAIAKAQFRCQQIRKQIPTSLTEKEKQHLQVLNKVMQAIPENAIVASDMTQLAYTAVDLLPLPTTMNWLHPTGYGTLGYALPAAIGAKLAAPERPVLVIVGDAGIQYTMQEMALASELGLNLVLLLWNNNRLQQIHGDMAQAGFKPFAVEQQNPDFHLLAKACGWHSTKVDSLDNLTSGLENALAQTSTCTLLELPEAAVI